MLLPLSVITQGKIEYYADTIIIILFATPSVLVPVFEAAPIFP
jgi:hypothetical protein